MPNLYIISGCNGAGKTTASYTILPELFNCREFVNADIIAAGLSPFNPESVALEAGQIMLQRIQELMKSGVDFAFETTLSTKSYISYINKAKEKGYEITLLYIWLPSVQQAFERVAERVENGGHNIPKHVIERRYHRGINNLIHLYIPICDNWIIVNNNEAATQVIANGNKKSVKFVENIDSWKIINILADEQSG